MKLTFSHEGSEYIADTASAINLGIALQFNGPQPNHFGTDHASSEVLRMGDFVGKTELGGSCNVESIEMIPHCNGTHTETVSHIIHEDIWVGHSALESTWLASLVSVPIRVAKNCGESYRPRLDDEDLVITARDLAQVANRFSANRAQALIMRTLPNSFMKRDRQYAEGTQPAFLTVEAMEWIVAAEFRHLLVDLPSVDRMYDDGLLTNHHLFWNVPEKTHALTADTRQDKTITEMIFVADEVEDGLYLLNLQIPPFASDAAPSRPIAFPVQKR